MDNTGNIHARTIDFPAIGLDHSPRCPRGGCMRHIKTDGLRTVAHGIMQGPWTPLGGKVLHHAA